MCLQGPSGQRRCLILWNRRYKWLRVLPCGSWNQIRVLREPLTTQHTERLSKAELPVCGLLAVGFPLQPHLKGPTRNMLTVCVCVCVSALGRLCLCGLLKEAAWVQDTDLLQ